MNDELRQKIAINYGLVLLGENYGFVNFSFERPFCLYNKVYVENVSGGSYSYINENSSLRNTSIGRYSSLSSDVVIGIGKHPHHFVGTSTSANVLFRELTAHGILPFANAPFSEYDWRPEHVSIGNDVWVGMNTLITGAHALKIGSGAVIGANSVVTKNIPAYAVAAGNPARVVKMRFAENICVALENSKWWDYEWKEFGAKYPQICAKYNPAMEPSEFLAWFNDEGKELLAPFLIKAKRHKTLLKDGKIVIEEDI